MALIIQIEYDGMDNVAGLFNSMADDLGQMIGKIDGDVSQLQNGGWKGVGAEGFYEEMELVRRQLVLMQNDLEKQARKINETSQKFQDAEAEMIALFSSL